MLHGSERFRPGRIFRMCLRQANDRIIRRLSVNFAQKKVRLAGAEEWRVFDWRQLTGIPDCDDRHAEGCEVLAEARPDHRTFVAEYEISLRGVAFGVEAPCQLGFAGEAVLEGLEPGFEHGFLFGVGGCGDLSFDLANLLGIMFAWRMVNRFMDADRRQALRRQHARGFVGWCYEQRPAGAVALNDVRGD